jgi:hypothetical protein
VNDKGKVLDVSGGKDNENQNIIVWKRHKGLNQQWDIIYADEYPDEPKKGELNKDFGLYVERPFYIVTQLSSHRYLDMVSNKFVIKTMNGRNTQEWWFDQKSLTIKTKSANKSWDIQSSGKTNNMQVYNTNSNWW